MIEKLTSYFITDYINIQSKTNNIKKKYVLNDEKKMDQVLKGISKHIVDHF